MSGFDAFKEFNAPLLAKLEEDKNYHEYNEAIKTALMNQEGPFTDFLPVYMNNKTSDHFLSDHDPCLFGFNYKTKMVMSFGRVENDGRSHGQASSMFNGSLYHYNIYDVKNDERYGFKNSGHLNQNDHNVVKKLNIAEQMNAEGLFSKCYEHLFRIQQHGLKNYGLPFVQLSTSNAISIKPTLNN